MLSLQITLSNGKKIFAISKTIAMLKIYNFLYFCFYCLVIKKPNDQSDSRALLLQSIMLANYAVDLLFLFILVFNIDLGMITLVIIAVFNILAYKLQYKYYFNNGKYKLAIEYFEPKFSKTRKKILGLLALFLFLSSTALFIWIGVTIGKQNRY